MSPEKDLTFISRRGSKRDRRLFVHGWRATDVPCFNGIRAIVVNDSPASREVISEYLTPWGIENAAVSSGAEALEMLKREPAGDEKQIVVLIDEQTPDMGALRLARAIKDQSGFKHSKVIMFSAEDGARNAGEAVDAWITKPCASVAPVQQSAGVIWKY